MAFRIIFTMISFIIIFNVITDYYVYKRIILKYTSRDVFRYTHKRINLIFILLNIWLAYEFTNPDSDPTSTIYTWSILIYLIVYIPKLIFMLVSWPELIWKKTHIFSIAGFVLGTMGAVMLIWGAAFGRFEFVTRTPEIHSTRLPKSFDNYKIVQFSDTHLGNFGHDDRIIDELVERINAMKPDLIVFTGDLVNTKANEIDHFKSKLSELKAKDGVYSIMGNHDYGDYVYWHHKEDYNKNLLTIAEKQKALGWKLLRNETTYLKKGNDSIALIGVDNWGEPPFLQYGNLDKAIAQDRAKGFKILLSHNPEHWRLVVAPSYDIDLTLAGHTHAMQMALKIGEDRYSPAVLKYKNWGGLYEKNGKKLYVNEGIGYVLYPMRFGSGPEITLLTLKKDGL